MNSIMQFVLYGSKKHLCHTIAWIIVCGCSIYICYLLIKVAFTATNIPNTLQQLSKIAVTTLLQSFIIHSKPLLDILMKPSSSPTAEARRNLRLNTIAQSNNHIKIVVVNITFYMTTTLLTNQQEFLVSSLYCQFFIFIYVVYMLTDILLSCTIYLSQLVLCQPQIFIGKSY